ncbi:hypothetical protein AWB85_22100 [Mycobacteroides immunogenum]|uniref:Uncharacterized protein n=1 Tax=Mycobacteroides immunogenum TaxID=83262 RepID=A0A179VBB9_9MYCO|nr:hypothetical protein [Mycobacteroides immunogenum]OAT69189.1 hypothetical protein AWB85_22100 [Mycobacteroides immunogenum]
MSDPASRPSAELAEVEIDRGLLPTRVQFRGGLQSDQYEKAFVAAYARALMDNSMARCETGDFDGPSIFPSRRARISGYLKARTWDEYCDMVGESLANDFRAESRFRDAVGEPGIAVTADYRRINGVNVSSPWAASVGAGVVASEIVSCANNIRAQRDREKSVVGTESLGDDELEVMLQQHAGRLLERTR